MLRLAPTSNRKRPTPKDPKMVQPRWATDSLVRGVEEALRAYNKPRSRPRNVTQPQERP